MEGCPESSTGAETRGDLPKTSGAPASGFSGIRIHPEILDPSPRIRSVWHVGAIGDVQNSALGFTAGSAFSPRWVMQQDCKKEDFVQFCKENNSSR